MPTARSQSAFQSDHEGDTHASRNPYFEEQRGILVREIALSLEQVLQNMNRLNRNLESIITVGNEFGSVEALWSQFEGVMGKHADNGENNGGAEAGEGDTTVHNEEDHRVTTSTVPLAGGDDNDQVKQEPDDEQ